MIVIVLFSPVFEGLNLKSLPVSQIIFTDNVFWSACKIKLLRIFTDDGDGDDVDDVDDVDDDDVDDDEVGQTIDCLLYTSRCV